MQTVADSYPWAQELEKTVVNSLVTSFGLDFLLFKDKLGGEVDTIHNVRKGVYATTKEQQRYEDRGEYDSAAYHQHANYIDTGARDKSLQQAGQLRDAYRNQTMRQDEQRNLDHIIAAKEIHDDPGRVLAELDGVELANQSSNLQTTLETINKSKKQTPIQEYVDKLPMLIEQHEKTLADQQKNLNSLPRDTPQQRDAADRLAAKVKSTKNKITSLKSIDPEEMLKKDTEARTAYNGSINASYYGSSKFLKAAGYQSGLSGLKMGTRQMLGMVMAEIWFEMRSQLPKILNDLKSKFSYEKFIAHLKNTFKGIWTRVKARFNDFLTAFKDGVFAGVMSSVTTTVFNIFASTQKLAIKIIRESWAQLVKALKLMFFNPDKLGLTDLCKALTGIASAAAGVAVGSIAHAELLPLCSFPFGSDIAMFAGALVTGLATLGLTYFVLHSEYAQKAWAFFESLMPHHGEVKQFEAINAELDRYMVELARIEFNLNPQELVAFSNALENCTNEIHRGEVLKDEAAKRGTTLPFEIGNTASTRKWLSSLATK